MKLLADQDVYVTTVRYLRNLGYDVITAYEIGLSKAEDIDLLKKAKEQNWLFVTRDRDFGGLNNLGTVRNSAKIRLNFCFDV